MSPDYNNPLGVLSEEAVHLQHSFDPAFVIDFGNGFGITQYMVYVILVFILTILIVLLVGKRLTLVPKNKFTNMVEYGYEFVRKDMGENAIGHGYKKHVPFLATLFFFILVANFIGLIPGAKAATGTISVTWALAVISFIYFNYWGVKAHGGWGYIKSIAPAGLPKPMVPIIWFFEFISLVLRVLTLAVRLYGNMFAGHMALGIFALATTVFLQSITSSVVGVVGIGWFALLLCMYALECLVAFLQAYVFTILSAVYISLATSEH